MPHRTIVTNIVDKELPTNRISTSKYNLINFFPKNLLHQFTQYSNIYFLIVGLLEMIPEISDSDGYPAIFVPLTFIGIDNVMNSFCYDDQRCF